MGVVGNDSTLEVEVAGLETGVIVIIHLNSGCSAVVSIGVVAVGATYNVIINALSVLVHILYAI